ncbi:MAG: hypothetical protein KIS94_08090 [Chitinophagales bacterium]|nr:hypothetical protein [Chitinophagales bacterium]
MNPLDWFLGIVYALIFYTLASRNAAKYSNNRLYTLYYLKGFRYKLVGMFGFVAIYLFYYKGGDSTNFFYATSPLYKFAFTNPSRFFEFIFSQDFYPWECITEAKKQGVGYITKGSAALTTIKIGAIVNLFTFNSYIALCVVFSYISYSFQWKAFQLITSVYPSLHKQLAFAFLMIPSVIFWGSGYGKDVVMFSCIMQFFYSFYTAFIFKKNALRHVIILLAIGYIMSLIRGFILLTILPCCVLMAAIYYRSAIQNSLMRFLIGPIFVLGGLAGSYLMVQNLGSTVQSYNLESLEQKAEGFRSWHTTQGGSTYSIEGDITSVSGVLSQAPKAMVITLFGPFVWEIRNIVMLLSGIESIIFLYLFTTKVFFNRKVYALFGVLIREHILMFCIPFVLILSVAIGLTSFNYGALVRYKIPILPFFACTFIIINYHLTRSAAQKIVVK